MGEAHKGGIMNEEANSVVLKEHEVLFLDFLGFAAAVKRWDDDRMGKLITVLVKIAEAQSTFDMNGAAQPNGSYRITTRPEITTFSDNLVVSYPILAKNPDDVEGLLSNGWAGMVREQMQNITAQVVMAALDVGLLVRGGLSRGKLYHHGRVVVGEAMVDAYCLEKNVARNPRVVVSSRVTDNDRLYTDTDDVRCLDYISAMMLLADDRRGDAKAWAQNRLEEIEKTIGALTERKHKVKWVYFKNNLRHAIDTW
jgi:hypothetical protein